MPSSTPNEEGLIVVKAASASGRKQTLAESPRGLACLPPSSEQTLHTDAMYPKVQTRRLLMNTRSWPGA